MARLGIFQILNKVAEAAKAEDKIQILRENDSGALRTILKYALDPSIEWDLPPTDPPFKPCPYPAQELRLLSEVRRLYLFIKGGNPNLTKMKREALYIELLESIHPEDAMVLNCAKNKKLPHKTITAKIVKQTFPDLIEEKARNEQVS